MSISTHSSLLPLPTFLQFPSHHNSCNSSPSWLIRFLSTHQERTEKTSPVQTNQPQSHRLLYNSIFYYWVKFQPTTPSKIFAFIGESTHVVSVLLWHYKKNSTVHFVRLFYVFYANEQSTQDNLQHNSTASFKFIPKFSRQPNMTLDRIEDYWLPILFYYQES